MLDDPQLDPQGTLIRMIRNDADVAALVASRVRGYEPMGQIFQNGHMVYAGDARGKEDYIAFIVVSALSAPPHRRVPVTWAEYSARCYGATPEHAWQVWAALVKALHETAPFVTNTGQGVYKTAIVSGGTQDHDPDTRQPFVIGSIQLIATTQAVTV
jgi:hypothetical protein